MIMTFVVIAKRLDLQPIFFLTFRHGNVRMNVSSATIKGTEMKNDNALMVRWIVSNLKALGFKEIQTKPKEEDLRYGTEYSNSIISLWLNIETLEEIYDLIGKGYFDNMNFSKVA